MTETQEESKWLALNKVYQSKLFINLGKSEEMNDVTFEVGSDEIECISGIRVIFALQSPVLKAQLYGKMAESKSLNETILIEDVTPQAFKYLKDVFYGCAKGLTVDIVLDVLYASKKYLLTDLECECYKFIEKLDNLKDWWYIIKKQQITTDVNMDDALIRKSQILIKNSNVIVKDYENIVKLTPEWFKKLIKNYSFVVEKEELIWELALHYCDQKWNEKIQYQAYKIFSEYDPNESEEEKKATIITDNEKEEENVSICKNSENKSDYVKSMMNEYFIDEIRFPIMDKDYFFANVENSSILSNKDLIDICKCFIETNINKKFKYESRFMWHKRKPYYQYFLSMYDIKSLKRNDKVLVNMVSGTYEEETIAVIKWDCEKEMSKNRINYVQFESDVIDKIDEKSNQILFKWESSPHANDDAISDENKHDSSVNNESTSNEKSNEKSNESNENEENNENNEKNEKNENECFMYENMTCEELRDSLFLCMTEAMTSQTFLPQSSDDIEKEICTFDGTKVLCKPCDADDEWTQGMATVSLPETNPWKKISVFVDNDDHDDNGDNDDNDDNDDNESRQKFFHPWNFESVRIM